MLINELVNVDFVGAKTERNTLKQTLKVTWIKYLSLTFCITFDIGFIIAHYSAKIAS